jgi:hypothetical protein
MAEENVHYVVHVRVEKVVKTVVSPRGVAAAAMVGDKQNREVEEVVNVTRKTPKIESAIAFAKNALDLVTE